jgi:hypothetical protein
MARRELKAGGGARAVTGPARAETIAAPKLSPSRARVSPRRACDGGAFRTPGVASADGHPGR